MRIHRGFTLIETMVALLVISVGMIGVAALHGQALSASGTAIRRSLAIGLASDIADRVRVNRSAQVAYEGIGADHNCDDPTDEGGADCSPVEMAEHDLFVWTSEVTQSLPGGQGTVDVDALANPPSYTVTVSWDEPTQSEQVAFTFEFQLPVY